MSFEIVTPSFNYDRVALQTRTKTFWFEILEKIRVLSLMVERLQAPADVPQVAIQTEDVKIDSVLHLPLELMSRIVYVQKYGHPAGDNTFDRAKLEEIEMELSLIYGSPNLTKQNESVSVVTAGTTFKQGETTWIDENTRQVVPPPT